MKKLYIFTALLLLVALLGGCMASGVPGTNSTGGSQPSQGATSPTGTTPTTATTPSTGTTEPEPFAFHVLAFPYRFSDEEFVIVRSVDQLTELCGGTLRDSVKQYDDTFFESNSLVIANYVIGMPEGEYSEYFISNLTEAADGSYEMTVDYFWWSERAFSTVLMDSRYGSSVAEVNRVLDDDAVIHVARTTYLIHGNEWEGMFANEDDTDYAIADEVTDFNCYNRETILSDANDLDSCIVRSVDDLEQLCGGTIPEDMKKYDDTYFAENSLILIHRYVPNGTRSERTVKSVYVTEKGSYLLVFRYTAIDSDAVQTRQCCVVEISNPISEDVSFYVAHDNGREEFEVTGQ